MTDRDWATVIWFTIAMGIVLARRGGRAWVRSSIPPLLREVISLTIGVPILIVLASIAASTYLAWYVSLWTPALTRDTVVWSVGALGLLFGATTRSGTEHFLRKAVVAAIGLSVLVEFYVNDVVTFSLPVEFLIILPLATTLALISVSIRVTDQDPTVQRTVNVVVAVASVLLLVAVTWRVATRWNAIDKLDELRALVLPLWLTITLVPTLYLIGLYSAYNAAFVWLRFRGRYGWTARARAKLAMMTTLRGRTREVRALNSVWVQKIAEASSIRESRETIKRFRRSPDVWESGDDV